MLRTLLSRVRPGLFATQIVSVGASGVLLGGIAYIAIGTVGSGLDHVILASEAALLASIIDHSTDYVDLLIDSEHTPGGAVVLDPALTVRVYQQIRSQQDSAAGRRPPGVVEALRLHGRLLRDHLVGEELRAVVREPRGRAAEVFHRL